jgi:hypothetical protein
MYITVEENTIQFLQLLLLCCRFFVYAYYHYYVYAVFVVAVAAFKNIFWLGVRPFGFRNRQDGQVVYKLS